MPYNHYGAGLEHAQRLAEHYGLIAHAPPIAEAGWWVPDEMGTNCFAFTRVGTVVRWLPGQMSEDAYKEFSEEFHRERHEEIAREKAGGAHDHKS
jgi:hypothetical protein